MALSGVNIDFLGGVLGSNFSLGFLSWPLTIIWIVGITNAINLSDGLDGLAGGISLIAFTCFGILAYQRGDQEIFILCLILVASILGFLRYNSHPAEIFMGDTGSLFLGYCLGTLSIAGNFKSVTVLTLITPVLILLVPIADTAWAIIRRIREGRSPFSADKMHFHHKLLDTGISHSQTVTVIYGICFALSLTAVALANNSAFKYLLIPLVIAGIVLFLMHVTGMVNVAKWSQEFSNVLDRFFSFQARTFLTRLSLRLIQAGMAIYLFTFMMGIMKAPTNLIIVAGTVIALVFFLGMSKSKSGHNYMIFSFFFLAAVMVIVIDSLPVVPSDAIVNNLMLLEPAGFILLAIGVFGKIIFKKRVDLFLSMPLEFFIFLVLVSIALVPQEVRIEFNLVQNVLRTFLLFLGMKAIALNYAGRESGALPAPAGS
jgi:UDP-GlcNAc:undecaprenyl-phosphate GlcNAc-1-phosphate transferase